MMSQKEEKNKSGKVEGKPLTILVMAKYNRIYIHKHTLKAIGDPEYVMLGYHPEAKCLMLMKSQKHDRQAVRLLVDHTGAGCIHSKGLITGIRRVGNVLMEDRSYLIKGAKDPQQSALCFMLEEARVVEDEA